MVQKRKINFSLDDEKITNRLAIPTKSGKKCGAIKADHMIIRKAQDNSNLELLALQPLELNGKLITRDNGYITLANFDDLRFPCEVCVNVPHLFKFILGTP